MNRARFARRCRGAAGVPEFGAYSLVIDARSPHEYAEDHLPGAVNLPVVDDAQYAEVGIRHKNDKHGAYLIGVEYSLRNITDQIKPLISRYDSSDRFLVYCFRGGKRSRWGCYLRTTRLRGRCAAASGRRYAMGARVNGRAAADLQLRVRPANRAAAIPACWALSRRGTFWT